MARLDALERYLRTGPADGELAGLRQFYRVEGYRPGEFRQRILEDAADGTLLYEHKQQVPTPLFFEKHSVERLPSTTWLVHFSPDADGIARRGFLFGQPDMHRLGWTGGRSAGTVPGWNFAFLARDDEIIDKVARRCKDGFGCSAVIFRAPGVGAVHRLDGAFEVLFWGPDVDRVLPAYPDEEEGWVARDRHGRSFLEEFHLSQVAEGIAITDRYGDPADRKRLRAALVRVGRGAPGPP
jgi:hypothetical protein